MKKLFALITLLAPMMAHAGPEDHTPGAVYMATTNAPSELSFLTLDTVRISDDETKMIIEVRYGNFFGEFNVTRASRHNEDRMHYTAEKVLFNKWNSGCGEGENATAVVDAMDEHAFGISPKALDITVTYTYTVDTCHSRPQTQVIKYKLVQ